MSSKEFSRWMAYDRIDPFGPRRDDLRAGKIAATFAEIHRDRQRHPEPFTADEFAIHFEAPEEEIEEAEAADPDVLLQKVLALNAIFGGKDLRPGATASA